MNRFWGGIVTAFVIIGLVGFIAVYFGLVPANADGQLLPMERKVAQMSLNATIAREAPKPPYPYSSSPAAIVAGAKIYMQYCADCHGSGTGDMSNMAAGMYLKPPQFAKHGVDDDPAGETYWKIEHGIRWTAMPAYATRLTEEQIWQVTYFLGVPAEKLTGQARDTFMTAHGE